MSERFPEFESTEFEDRWRRVRTMMKESRLDALFITSENNFRYLSGHVTPFWVSKSRPLFFLLPLRGDPALFVTANQLTTARATSWVSDVRSWEGFVREGINLVVGTLHELGLAKARIGAELGLEQRLGVSFADFVRLQKLLPKTQFVDAADLLWRLRVVKSAAEIGYLRRSAAIGSKAFHDAFHAAREGVTEQEIFATFVSSTIARGAERPGYVPVHSGDGNYDRIASGPSNRSLRRGDLLWMDGGCVYHGYWSDFARMVAVGRAADLQRQRYRTVRTVMHKCVQAVRPGVPMADLTRLAMKQFEDAGLTLNAHSRVGHGIGLDITEPPSINLADPAIVEPGMALTMEPTCATEFGFFSLRRISSSHPTGTNC